MLRNSGSDLNYQAIPLTKNFRQATTLEAEHGLNISRYLLPPSKKDKKTFTGSALTYKTNRHDKEDWEFRYTTVLVPGCWWWYLFAVTNNVMFMLDSFRYKQKNKPVSLVKTHLNLSGHLTLGPINTCERMIVALWNKTKYFSPLVHLISNHRFWWSEDLRNHSRQKYSKRSTTTNYFEPRQVMSNQILFICYFKSSSVKLKFPEI